MQPVSNAAVNFRADPASGIALRLFCDLSCGSKAYRDTLLPLHKKMTKYRKASVSKQSRAVHSLQEHVAIYEALKARDGKRAEELTVRHVENARDSIMSMEI